MKTQHLLWFAAMALATGCGDGSGKSPQSTNATSSGDSLATAPVDYLNTVVKQQQYAVKTIDVASVNKAIQLFQVDQGRLPTSLEELVEKKFLPEIPKTPYGTKLEYDANDGTVKVVKE
jgi:hypothetical protein